jgi:hypothetical protein
LGSDQRWSQTGQRTTRRYLERETTRARVTLHFEQRGIGGRGLTRRSSVVVAVVIEVVASDMACR